MKNTSMQQGKYALIAVCLSALMLGLEISSIPPVLSTIEKVMGASFSQLQWIMTAYTIAMTTILMAVGTIADRYGRKKIFILGIVFFGITSLICGLTINATVLIIARFLQGFSAAMMLICQISILSNQFRDGKERGNAFAFWGIVFGAGLGFGPIIGSLMLTYINWQSVFLIHVFLSIITLLLGVKGVQESRNTNAAKLDLKGILTLSISVFCLVLFITQGPRLGFNSIEALSIIGLSIISFIAFVVVERTNSQAMFEFSVFKIRNFSGALLGSMGQNFSFWPFIIYLPIYFHLALGYNSIETGLALLAYTLPTLFIPPFAERLTVRYKPRMVIPIGLCIISTGFILMLIANRHNQEAWIMLLGCMLAGVGVGATNTTATNTITASVPVERAGMASGSDTSARMISLAFNIAVMGFLLVEGIIVYLNNHLNLIGHEQIRGLAEKIAMGDTTAVESSISHITDPNDIIHIALISGFEWLMAYAATSACLLAIISFAVFSLRNKLYCQSVLNEYKN
ncbi:MFS transporter [Xenorhabdus eapokensis]|uniref:Putative permease of the major facilitator superfamily n=1 Tax=Xenorhabdus eapokensis TaxID=1873482 RepID=A0A1Q5TD58_9GAMM|nr:MFS transporter [Xenorhabdus eapokensis]OKO98150.1 putative permease of the major facilitator superfamily [Xenorhabdus eapokensis]